MVSRQSSRASRPSYVMRSGLADDFARSVVSELSDPGQHLRRISLLRPVYRIKWCCIMLNDFLPAGSRRRSFAQQPQPPIRVQVNEVVVPVTVTDEKGRFVSDLEQSDFKLFDQGKEQSIRYFNRERNQRVVVGFLVDLSNQSRSQWKSLQDATIELVLNLLPGDKKYAGYLIGYGNEAELMVNTTSDPDPIVERLRKI